MWNGVWACEIIWSSWVEGEKSTRKEG